MRELALQVQHLGKQYTIGLSGHHHSTLRDQLMASAKALVRRNTHPHAGNRTIWALRDVSFEITRGELVGIIGHNGAGKSTLLKILSRITRPTVGRAAIWGRVGSLLEVGTGFHAELTGRENLYLSGSILGMPKAEIDQKFEQIVAFAEVEHFMDTPVKHYSSGMYMRLAFAVAAHLDPDILLIDEVLSVGDLAFQRKCLDYAKRLQESHATVLFVSHNMFAVKALCHRVLYVADGQIHFDGSPEDAIQLYERDSRLSTAPWAQHLLGADPSQRPITITDIELLDEAGESRRVFDYGERLRIRLHFDASEHVADPNFNISIFRSDNVPCCNYNTAMDGFKIASLYGQGTIEVVTPPLKLVAELYAIQVMVWDATFQQLYSAQIGTTFHVRHLLLSPHFGVFHEAADWHWEPGTAEASGRPHAHITAVPQHPS
jgi:lipopolysaccharide transport system ATP-binding protein